MLVESDPEQLVSSARSDIASKQSRLRPVWTAFLKKTVAAQLHFLGLLAASAGLVVLLKLAALKSDATHFYICLIFGITSILVFGISSIYHFLYDGFRISSSLERRLEDLDHYAIFLFIAGTYTPIIMNAASPPWNRILLWMIWSVSLAGIAYTSLRSRLPPWARHRYINTMIFVLMGGLFIFRIHETLAHLNSREIVFLMAGCASYSIGAIIYAIKKPNLFVGVFGFHELWHLMVLLGFGFHYLLILEFYS